MSDNGSLYKRPIYLSKIQLRAISRGNMITIRRNKSMLRLAPKGYSDEKAQIRMQIDKLKYKLKRIKKGE